MDFHRVTVKPSRLSISRYPTLFTMKGLLVCVVCVVCSIVTATGYWARPRRARVDRHIQSSNNMHTICILNEVNDDVYVYRGALCVGHRDHNTRV